MKKWEELDSDNERGYKITIAMAGRGETRDKDGRLQKTAGSTTVPEPPEL
jgi:hypothetical protein